MRRSSSTPSSNSWLPTPVTSSPSAFIASIVGSSWNGAESSGLAPIRSPAPTVSVFGFCARSCLRCVARYSTPPAAIDRRAVGSTRRCAPDEPGRRLEVAVEVVEREQLDLGVLVVLLRALGGEGLRRGGDEHEPERREHGNGASHLSLPFSRFPDDVRLPERGDPMPIGALIRQPFASAQVSPTPASTASGGSSG